jgi:hypothetical protein
LSNDNLKQAPAWGSFFTRKQEHPDNEKIIAMMPRLLDDKSLKRYQASLHEIELDFNIKKRRGHRPRFEHNPLHLIDVYEKLRTKHTAVKQLLLTTDDDDVKRKCIRRAQQLKQRATYLQKLIEPARADIIHYRAINNRLTEHYEARRIDREMNALRGQMLKEVRHFGNKIIETWTRLGYRDERYESNRRIINKVTFEEAWASEDEIIYKIFVSKLTVFGNTRSKLPDRVKAIDLIKHEVCQELEAALQRPIYSPHNSPDHGGHFLSFDNGVFIVVCRIDYPGGLPTTVSMNDVMSLYPHHQKQWGRILLPSGVKRGRKANWVAISNSTPHFMVNGITGSGKTTVFKSWLCAIITMNSPDEVRFLLTDLKGGGDFRDFADAPHILGDIIKKPADLRDELQKINAIIEERSEKVGAVAKDIDTYNASVAPHERLPRIIIMIDEYSATSRMGDDKDVKFAIDKVVDSVARLGRAWGVLLWIGNQQPYADAVPKGVKGNITWHATGFQMTLGASMSAVGNASATRLEKIAGRMLVNDGKEIITVQMQDCTDDDIRRALKDARMWGAPTTLTEWDTLPTSLPAEHDNKTSPSFSVDEFIQYAIEELDGALSARRIYDGIKHLHNISKRDVEALRDQVIDMDEIIYDGQTYDIQKRGMGYVLVSQLPIETDMPNPDEQREIEREMGNEPTNA